MKLEKGDELYHLFLFSTFGWELDSVQSSFQLYLLNGKMLHAW